MKDCKLRFSNRIENYVRDRAGYRKELVEDLVLCVIDRSVKEEAPLVGPQCRAIALSKS